MATGDGPQGQSNANERDKSAAGQQYHGPSSLPGPVEDGQSSGKQIGAAVAATAPSTATTSSNCGPGRPLILITDANLDQFVRDTTTDEEASDSPEEHQGCGPGGGERQDVCEPSSAHQNNGTQMHKQRQQIHIQQQQQQQGERVEEVDGISYRIVAAVTRPASALQQQFRLRASSNPDENNNNDNDNNNVCKPQADQTTMSKTNLRRSSSAAPQTGRNTANKRRQSTALGLAGQPGASRFGSMRRKSSAFVASLFANQSRSSHELGANGGNANDSIKPPRRMSIYELTKSPPPETSIEHYLKERRRSSTVSAKFVQQQLEQQSTFEANYCQRQQYFKDLNEKLINQDRRLLNVVANRGQLHRHSVDIAQLPLELAQAKAKQQQQQQQQQLVATTETLPEETEEEGGGLGLGQGVGNDNVDEKNEDASCNDNEDADYHHDDNDDRVRLQTKQTKKQHQQQLTSIDQVPSDFRDQQQINASGQLLASGASSRLQLASISEDNALTEQNTQLGARATKQRALLKKFQKLDPTSLSSSPAPDVKIGQRVAYKEYYGNEFGTIRWIGRVPQISPNWTVGVEFDNAIGEGDGSLNGRRYFIAKDCFAKFLSLDAVALVDQHVGRPEPGTMISVMSAAVRPGQMISIQRVSTVHVQHCFLNAPHRRPVGADILAVNTRLHCQCPNCGPCAHVVKPPRTQRLRTGKNATHMCQFSTYTCCGMQSQEETLCTYTGNKVSSSPPPPPLVGHSPPFYNSWIEGSGYLTNLQAQQSKLMPEEYRLGAAPEDIIRRDAGGGRTSSRRGSGRHHHDATFSAFNEDESPKTPNENTIRALSSNSKDRPSSSLHRRRRHHHGHNCSKKASRHRSRSRSPIYTNLQDNAQYFSNFFNGTPCSNSQDNVNLQKSATHSSCGRGEQQNDYLLQQLNDKTIWPPSYKSAISSSKENGTMDEASFSAKDGKKVSKTADPSSAVLGTAYSSDARDLNESRAQNPIENGLGDDGTPTKPAKVVYRDSIENRYLFPTDDIIDTTLEADLEDLSQARYGRLAQGRSTGGTSLGSRNILKGLRSLVSCLSTTKSNQSDFDRRSKNTLRFYEHPTDGGLNKSQPLTRPASGVTSSCSGSYNNNGRSRNRNSSNFSNTSDSFESPSRKAGYKATRSNNNDDRTNQTVQPYGLEESLADNCNFFCRHEKSIQGCNCSRSGLNSTSSHSSVIQSENSKFDCQQAIPWDAYATTIGHNFVGESASCDGDAKTRNSDFKSYHHKTTTTTTHMNQARRQISSSSDCGFSSASQNSVNFQSHPSCSPIFTVEDEQRRINQIYKRIVARLISSTPALAITNEDLTKLKKALFEIHSENCCLHGHGEQILGHAQNQHSRCHFIESGECDQIISDIIRNSMLNLNLNSDLSSSANVPSAVATNPATYTSLNENESIGSDEISMRMQNSCTEQRQQLTSLERQISQASWNCSNDYATERPDSARIVLDIERTEKARKCPSSQSGQASDPMNHGTHNDSPECHSRQTLSRSSDKQSFIATNQQATADNSMKSVTNLVRAVSEKCDSTTSLPKTFELKLTLSISADDERLKAHKLHGTSDQLDSEDFGARQNETSAAEATSSIKSSGSGFNISIVSESTDNENKSSSGKTTNNSSIAGDHPQEISICKSINIDQILIGGEIGSCD